MPPRIHHVIDSSATGAGSVRPLVCGLIAQLESLGFTSTLNHAVEDSHESAVNATRDADVVHVHACDYEALIGAARLAKHLQKPFILSPAGELDPAAIRRQPRRMRWRGKLYERGLIRRAGALLAQNDAEAAALRRRYSREVEILSYGFLAEAEGTKSQASGANPPPPPKGRCILMLAEFEPQAGSAALLKAFAELGPDANDWYVVIAGSGQGNYRKMLEAAIRRKGGDNRVTLARADDEVTRRAWLVRADVLVSPSFEPGPATSILQAIAAGVPVVASRQILPDALSDSVIPCDANRGGIREGLRRMLKMNDNERLDLANRAKSVVCGELGWANLADRYVSLYNSLA